MTISSTPVKLVLRPWFWILSKSTKGDPNSTNIRDFFLSQTKKPIFFARKNPLESVGLLVFGIGALYSLLGMSKDIRAKKLYGGILALGGVLTTFIGTYFGVNLNPFEKRELVCGASPGDQKVSPEEPTVECTGERVPTDSKDDYGSETATTLDPAFDV